MDPSWLYRGNIFFVVFPFVMPKREMKNQKKRKAWRKRHGGGGNWEKKTKGKGKNCQLTTIITDSKWHERRFRLCYVNWVPFSDALPRARNGEKRGTSTRHNKPRERGQERKGGKNGEEWEREAKIRINKVGNPKRILATVSRPLLEVEHIFMEHYALVQSQHHNGWDFFHIEGKGEMVVWVMAISRKTCKKHEICREWK